MQPGTMKYQAILPHLQSVNTVRIKVIFESFFKLFFEYSNILIHKMNSSMVNFVFYDNAAKPS